MNSGHAINEEQCLACRAARLAVPLPTPETRACLSIVQVTVGHEEYAVELAYVREIFRFTDLTPIPRVPGYVMGLVNVRGRPVCLIDIRVFFEIPQQGLHDRSRALILAAGNMEFGVLIDAVGHVRQVPIAAIETALPSLTGVRARYLKGVTTDGVAILDGDKLLGDNSLVVGRSADALSPIEPDSRPQA